MKRSRQLFILLILLFTIQILNAQETAKQLYLTQDARYSFEINNEKAQIPCASNLDITAYHPNVERFILAIHSSSYNADTYLNSVIELSEHYGQLQDKYLVLAPSLFKYNKTDLKDIVTWDVNPFWGSSRASYKGEKITLSAYEIIDHMLNTIVRSGSFPNIKSIVILGYSAGGQMVNRYAASNKFEYRVAKRLGIKMKYLVMAPSSYVYFNNKRAVTGTTDRFHIPRLEQKKYNNWGYGLDNLYSYHKKNFITADYMRKNYYNKKILYLVGSKDNKKDSSMSTTKGAILQGDNRMQRALIYYNYLQDYFSTKITKNQKMAIIEGVGHWGRGLMASKEGLEFIFLD